MAGLESLALTADLTADGRGAVSTSLRPGTWSQLRWAPANALLLLVAAPWAPLFWLLLAGSGWLARRRQAPPAWWGLWAFALLANLRLVLTGFASGLAAAPALAVLWWLMANRWKDQPLARRGSSATGASRSGRVLRGESGRSSARAQSFLQWPTSLAKQRTWPHPGGREGRTGSRCSAGRRRATGCNRQAPIFATGWGAHWYLLTGHPNPTAFDVVMAGMGSTEPERTELWQALTAAPPHAIFISAKRPASDVMGALGLKSWWQRAAHDYTDRAPAGVSTWKLFFQVETQQLGT